MQAAEWLRTATSRLADAGIASARLDCLILLEDVTGKDRAWLLAHPEYTLDAAQARLLDDKLARRTQHIPLAYIRNRTEFYGRTFYVDEHVLEPRPESETMISLLKNLRLPEKPVVIDVGTGSGALAITTSMELPQATVFGTDIDPACLAVASKNCDNLSSHVYFVAADLLEPRSGSLPAPDVILANLPYIPDDWQINQAAMQEPRIAIFGGPDGLDLYRRLFAQIDSMEHAPAFILTESLPPHHDILTQIAAGYGYALEGKQDFIQLFATSGS